MDRKTLKALSWSQMIDKIWWLLLISFIISLIVGFAAGTISALFTTPIIVASAFAAAAEADPLVFDLLNLANSVASIFSSYLYLFVSAPLSLSLVMIYLGIANGNAPKIEDTFVGFKRYWKSVGLYFFLTLFTSLWAMLFFVPGIIKSYSYAMAPYILAKNPTMKPLDAITESRKMMNGHKWELFVLDLSFTGWVLLTVVTFGIAGIWYVPYHETARANFYKKLNGELI